MWTRKSALAAGAALVLLVGGLSLPIPNVALVATALGLLAYLLVGALQDRRVRMTFSRKASGERLFETETLDVEYQVENVGSTPAFVEVRDRIPETVRLAKGSNFNLYQLRPRSGASGSYSLACPLRGHYRAGPPGYRVRDVFSLFFEEREGTEITYFTVYPQEEDPRHVPAESSTPNTSIGSYSVLKPGQGMEFFGLRAYAVGDSFRDVNWKASAKSKDLVVNQRMHETTAEVVVFLDARAVSGAGRLDANPLLLGCRGVSTVLTYYLDKRDKLRLVTYGEGVTTLGPDVGERHRFKVLDHLAALEAKGSARLGDAVDKALPTLKRKGPVVILSCLVDDPTITNAASTLRTLDMDMLVLCPEVPATGDAALDELLKVERDAGIAKLRGYGARVIDWKQGETLTVAILQGMFV